MRKQSLRSSLADLRAVMREASDSEARTQSVVAQYVCVSANGYIEDYIRNRVLDRLRKRCDENIYRLLTGIVSKYYNFKSEKIIAIIEECIPENHVRAKKFLEDIGEFREAIGSVVGNKNSVGHSGSSTVTIRRVDKWLDIIINHLDKFDTACFD
ncbi:MAG: hypothetical protein ACKVS5_00870 [Parvularculaceae bacterium]